MLPVLRLRIPDEVEIPWADLASQFEQAPKEHDLEAGQSISTWNWGKNHRTDLDPWFAPVRNLITQTVKGFMPEVEETYDEWVNNSWMNRHWRSGQTLPHKHEGCDLVFSCYLSAEANTGAFLLKWQNQWYRVPVTTGDILVFPGMIEHATEANQTDIERTVLTVNASPTGIGWHNIPQPGELIAKGFTMSQALAEIRTQYLATHTLFQSRIKNLTATLLEANQEQFEPLDAQFSEAAA